jgi:hypothetical protein
MRIVAPLAALAALTLAPAAHADDASASLAVAADAPDTPEPPVVHYPPPSTRWKLMGIGLFITGAAWGASFASGQYWSTVPGAAQLKIPVAGPWIALGKSGCASDDTNCSGAKIGVRAAIYVLDGIAQLAGLGLIAEGIVMKTEPRRERSSFLGVKVGGVEVTALPVASPSMTGVGLVGSF